MSAPAPSLPAAAATAAAGPTPLDRAAGLLSRWSARLGGLAILASAILVSVEVVLRNLPGGMPDGVRLHSFDLTNYGFAAGVAFSFSYALTERAHIRIDIVYARLPLALRATLDVCALAGMTTMACVMAWHGWGVALRSAKMGAMPNSTLALPLAVPQSVWAAGLTWFALVAGLLTLQATWRLVRGRLALVHATAGVVHEEDAA